MLVSFGVVVTFNNTIANKLRHYEQKKFLKNR